MLSTDPKSLRQTIRLIHCLQKERGATCTVAAALDSSQTQSLNEDFANLSFNDNINGGPFRRASNSPVKTKPSGNAEMERMDYAQRRIDRNTKMMMQVMNCTRLKTDRALADISIQGTVQSNAGPDVFGPTSGSAKKKVGAPFREALLRIRKMVNTETTTKSCDKMSPSDQTSSQGNFRRIFMAYNALTVHIIHENIVVNNTRSLNGFSLPPPKENDTGPLGNRARADTSPLRPSGNMSFNKSTPKLNTSMELQKPETIIKPPPKHNRMVASADAHFFEQMFPTINKNKEHSGSLGKDTNTALPHPKFSPASQNHSNSRKPPLPMTANRAHGEEDKDKEKSNTRRNVLRSKSLLSLLLSFVQLKESTSIERTFLTSLLSMSETPTKTDEIDTDSIPTINESERAAGMGLPTPTKSKIARPQPIRRRTLSQEGERLVNDLVMEMENQHLMIRKLRKKAREVEEYDLKDGYRWSISKMVEQTVQMTPELAELHNLVRQNFDMQAFSNSITMEKFWAMITFYIDRLHALELLIVEEIESCYPPPPPIEDTPSPVSVTATFPPDELPVSDPVNPSSPPLSISSKASSADKELAVFDKSLLLSALSSEKDAHTFDIAPNEAQKVLESMPPNQLKKCILSMFGGISPKGNQPDDDIFSLSDDGSLFDDVAPQPASEPHIPTEIEIKDNNAAQEPPLKEWLIDLYQVSFIKRIGRGCAGTTYVGRWQNQPVAIKVAAMTQMGVEGWGTEIRSLQRLHHPNIIRFYGAIYNDHPRTHCLVLEYCDCGDLSIALKMEQLPKNFFERAATSMANGMAYLHTKNILHRDIKPGNILVHGDLVGGDFMVKLTDFGLATMTKSDEEHTAETGTYRWMAPEVIRHESYSYEADVYSFSIVVWQLLTREVPFHGYSQVQAATMVALDHARPPFPHGIPDLVRSLISEGWDKTPKARPSFEDIAKRLGGLNDLTDREKEWLQYPLGHRVYIPQPPEIVRKTGQPPSKSFFFGKKKKEKAHH